MICYLDIDGVLANFRKGVHDAFGIPYDYSTLSDKWYFWEDWDKVTFEDVNAVCDKGFWQKLEWMHDGLKIFKTIFNEFINDIYLLTTPMPHPESASGKILWVDKHVPVFNKHLIITRAPKSLLAGPDRLLIDDKDQNIEEFITAGGQGILVPRPWNKNHDCQQSSYDYIAHKLDEVIT